MQPMAILSHVDNIANVYMQVSINMPKGITRALKIYVRRLAIIMLNYKVVFSDLAIADLNNIVQYITENESYTCAKYVERELLRTAKCLTTFPNGYTKDEYASTPDLTVRFIVKWNYKLVYTVQEDTVIIASIFHCSQNPIKLKNLF